MAGLRLQPGRPWPMGATVDGDGVNVAVFSAHATAVELCLYDEAGQVETARLPLPERTGDVWHGRLPGAGAGLVYGLRAHGPWAPREGQRFNPQKLLLDPWARETVGQFAWSELHRGHDSRDPLLADPRDNGALALKARVVDDRYDWGDDRAPRTPWADSVLYETHVRGFSMLHPGVPEALRGTYAGLASDMAIDHFRRLGITALSLLPVHRFLDEERLVGMGLRNYWGYNSVGFFCPEPRYASAAAQGGREVRDEFRQMVRRLHAAGIEVILDVVYNHSAETDEAGPTLSWRGLDNASYYLLRGDDRRFYENHTGCGNTFNLANPQVLQMVLDSLRYWVQEMHVDGFRFDLATVLGRGPQGFDAQAAFFACLAQDPALAGCKLIAEPWDIGPGGYQLGNFPGGWVEWNDRFRDATRGYWLRGEGTRGDLAQRLCGSADRFRSPGRAPTASLNYVVSHDGFTLRDLVSYDQRHNLANGEQNRDGHAHNLSWNCGAEGETTDPAVRALRERLQRALLSVLLLAQGTPMLAAGDELGHTQGGNNNPYCQDNPITWIDWSAGDEALVEFCAALVHLRRRLQPLGPRWYDDASAEAPQGLRWLRPDGHPMQADDWSRPAARGLMLHVGQPGLGEGPLLLVLNAAADADDFQLPAGRWQRLMDSAAPPTTWNAVAASTGNCAVAARSLQLWQLAKEP